jgi:hypothetical protein
MKDQYTVRDAIDSSINPDHVPSLSRRVFKSRKAMQERGL